MPEKRSILLENGIFTGLEGNRAVVLESFKRDIRHQEPKLY